MTEAGYTTLGVVDTPFYQVNGYSYDREFNFFYDMKSQLLGTPHYSSYTAPNKTKRQGEGKLPQWPITGKVKPDPRVGEMDCPAPLTMVQAAKCLEEIYQDKFFALVDTWDPHQPWDPPAYYVKHYLPDYAGERVHPPYGECKKHGMTDRDIAVARASIAASSNSSIAGSGICSTSLPISASRTPPPSSSPRTTASSWESMG